MCIVLLFIVQNKIKNSSPSIETKTETSKYSFVVFVRQVITGLYILKYLQMFENINGVKIPFPVMNHTIRLSHEHQHHKQIYSIISKNQCKYFIFITKRTQQMKNKKQK